MRQLLSVGIFIAVFLSLNPAHSQTYIEPTIGFVYIKNTGLNTFEPHDWSSGAVSDKNFNSNLNFGIGASRKVTEKVFIELRGQFSQNKMTFTDTGIVGYTDIQFNRIGLTAIPSIIIGKNYHFGLGISYQRLNKFIIGKETLNFWTDFGESINQNQLGWVSSFAFKVNSFILGVKYFNLHSIKTEDQHQIEKTTVIELSLAYRIKLLSAK